MRQFFGRVFAVIGAITVVLVLLLFVFIAVAGGGKKSVAANTVLELDLTAGVVEDVLDDPVAQFRAKSAPALRSLVEGLHAAARDPKVKGLIVKTGSSPIAPGHLQEIRDALLDFRAGRKFAIAWAEAFDATNRGFFSYYLASACDEVWLLPGSFFGVTGIELEGEFIRGALDKLGVVPRFEHRHEYKSASEFYTNKAWSDPAREAVNRVKESVYGQMIRGIAQGRRMTEPQVRELIDTCPLLAGEALKSKLVDRLGYRDEAYAAAKSRAGDSARLLYFGQYVGRANLPNRKGPRVALIYGNGPILPGKSQYDPLEDTQTMGSDTVTKAFRLAREDREVKAILFRVDSPGGSAVASDAISREVILARKAGKPVVVSMSAVAGSGGYWVSMDADRIVSQPATITGSIGVLGGKLVTKGLWDKLGISFDSVASGKNAGMFNGIRDFSPAQLERFRAELDAIYETFTSRVAAGRKMPKEKVLQIAKGRIWSGEDARPLGLVDELGGFNIAIAEVKKLIGSKQTDSIELKVYPPKKTRFQALMEILAGEGKENSEEAALGALVQALDALRPAVRAARAAGLTSRRTGELEMTMPVW
jgi:protease-4